MDRLLRTVAATFAALLIGYVVQVRARNGSWAWDIDRGSARLKRALVLYVTPVTLALSFWTLQLELWMLSLPVLGLAAQVLGGVLALGAARWWRMAPAQAGSMFVCGLMSNLHSLGGLVTLLFFGEAGYAVGAVYRISEPAVMFGVGFPMAAAMAGRQGDRPGRRGDWIRRILTDPYVLIPNLGLVTGIILRALGIPRPPVLDAVNPVLIVGSSLLMVFAIGLTFRPGRVRDYVRPALAVAGIKFVALPLVMGLAAYALGYAGTGDGLAFKVVVTMAAMPVAFNALVPPALYGLDLDLANSCWLLTTAGLLLMLPLLYLVLA